MTETEEMKICFDEMEKLKAKMEELREKRKVEEEKKLLRELTMEPNLKVLKTWLDDYQSSLKKQIEKMLVSVDYDQYNVLTEKLLIINQIYSLRPKPKPKPTNDEVVKSHIQAIYNMFNIINKRLDDIESKLS